MSNAQDESQLSLRVRARLRELSWTQKRLAREVDVADSSISDLLNGKITLTAEMAKKIASVPELKFTKEELLLWGGVWPTARPSRRRDVAQELFDKLSVVEQDLVIDFMVTISRRARDND